MRLELWMQRGDELVFQDEFAHAEPVLGEDADAAVAALSRGLDRVVERVVARMRDNDLFAAAYAEKVGEAGPRAAEPPR